MRERFSKRKSYRFFVEVDKGSAVCMGIKMKRIGVEKYVEKKARNEGNMHGRRKPAAKSVLHCIARQWREKYACLFLRAAYL